jgi:hypothetical protein
MPESGPDLPQPVTLTDGLVLATAVVNAVAEERFIRGALPIAFAGDDRPAVATVLNVLVPAATPSGGPRSDWGPVGG